MSGIDGGDWIVVGASLGGVGLLIASTEAFAARRRRREGRAALLLLLMDLTAAEAAVQVLRNGVMVEDQIARLLRRESVASYIRELENRLRVEEIGFIARQFMVAEGLFEEWRSGNRQGDYLPKIEAELSLAHELVGAKIEMSTPFFWLRHPAESRRLRRRVAELTGVEQAD